MFAKQIFITLAGCGLLMTPLPGALRAGGETEYVFAIYSVAKDAPELARVELEPEPIVSEADITRYDWNRHTITLNAGYARKLPSLEVVGVRGKPFVVVAGGQRCYRGAWWTSLSSAGTEEPVIDVLAQRPGELHIDLGYPPSEFHRRADPRADPRVHDALRGVNKLTE